MTTQLPFNLEDLQFDLDLNNIEFEIDAIQNEILQFYIQTDLRFRRAFYTNFTPQFFRMLRDQARLKHPVYLSCSGAVRSGKSEGMITVCVIHSALNNKIFSVDYICGNSLEYLEKVKEMPEEMTKDSIFLIDESKNAVFSVGSFAKRMKLQDVANITAKFNISNIMVCPTKVANVDANYSLRSFGKGVHKDKPTNPDGSFNYVGITRYMLYNLQGGDRVNGHPLGMIYIPQFTKLFPKDFADKLNADYQAKKDAWIQGEMKSDENVLTEMRIKIAKNFFHNEKCMELKKKERMTFIQLSLGGDYSRGEIEDIVNITCLLDKGVIPDD